MILTGLPLASAQDFSSLQSDDVHKKINSLKSVRASSPISIFTKTGRIKTGFRIHKKNGKALTTTLDGEGIKFGLSLKAIRKLLSEKPELIILPIELPEGPVELELFPANVLPDGLGVTDEKGNPLPSEKQIAYRGQVKDQADSLAGISFFESGILMGFVSLNGNTYDVGNLRPDKKSALRPLIGFSEKDQGVASDLEAVIHETGNLDSGGKPCAGDLLPPPASAAIHSEPVPQALIAANPTLRPVRVHLVADFDLYRKYNSNSVTLTNFITGLFNQTATIYQNEGVLLEIAGIKIFTSPDPFASLPATANSFDFLEAFRLYMIENLPHPGDLAHLLSARSLGLGGIAAVDVVCNTRYGYGFSNIYNTYSVAPTYSWSVYVLTHELGHNLGSPHTHACFWTVNGVANQAVDGCASPAPNEGTCTKPAVPTGGGTIMSYCHQNSTGINFSKGLGQLPGDKIRNSLSRDACLQSPIDPAAPTITFQSGMLTGRIATWASHPISVSVSDPVNLSKVEYFVDNLPICTATPVQDLCSITVLGKGKNYTVKVRATGSTGKMSEKSVVLKAE
jgi:hypothetical protein